MATQAIVKLRDIFAFVHECMRTKTWILSLFLLTGVAPLSARVALLVGEPFGRFAFFSPTGHAAIYLSRVCAESPTRLRLCKPDEAGVVISRYNRVAGYDWIAMPLLSYLYAVDRPEDVLTFADTASVAQIRNAYRRAHLQELAPDGPEGETPKEGWTQLVGAAYDRRIYGFAFETTPEDDERLILFLNSQRNQRRFHLLYRNCADFARSIINFYYPTALRRNLIADVGISTPKHSAKALVGYCRRRPDLCLSRFMIPQVPGRRRSTKVRGVSEFLIWSKKYVAPLLLVEPWAAAVAAGAYLTSGRFNPTQQNQAVCAPSALAACMETAEVGAHSGGEDTAGLIGIAALAER
ncbi:MAG: hypothetical protein ABFD89_21500 [Bryobacteraceae bacterium]